LAQSSHNPGLANELGSHLNLLDDRKRRRLSPSPSTSERSSLSSTLSSRSLSPSPLRPAEEDQLSEDDSDTDREFSLLENYQNTPHECLRFHPLHPPEPNVSIANLLRVVSRQRYLEGNEMSMLAYARAAAPGSDCESRTSGATERCGQASWRDGQRVPSQLKG